MASVSIQPSPPTQGVKLGDVYNIIFPLTVSQCEPVLIFYDTASTYDLDISTPDAQVIVKLTVPSGIGYLEWVCDVPAGDGFIAAGAYAKYYVVQPGSSSSCLRDITTTYSLASYDTSLFQSYTQRPSNTASLSLATFTAAETVSYPAVSFSTITINPELVISSPAYSPSHSATPSVTITSSTTPFHPGSPSHKSNAAAIAGGITGGFVMILLGFLIIFCWARRYRKSSRDIIYHATATSEPVGDVEGSKLKKAESMHASGKLSSLADKSPTPDIDLPTGTTSGSRQNPSDVVTALDALSRLDPTERRSLVSMLHNVMASDPSPGSVSEDARLAPPPYDV